MEGPGDEQEQRRMKVQAGRVKLAHFRQRKSKGEGANPQKKASKRKGASVHTHDMAAEENSLVTAEGVLGEPKSDAENTSIEVCLESRELNMPECQERMSDLETRLHMKQEAINSLTEGVAELQERLEQESASRELQQELQTAVHERDDIITQLSSNLQQALRSREEMQEEALILANQIQALQLQLQEASEVLRSKSPGRTDLCQTQQQISVIQSNLREQTLHMSQLNKRAQDLEKELETSHKTTKDKENQMAKLEDLIRGQEERMTILQEKLEMSESSVSLLQQELSERDQVVLKLGHEVSVSKQTKQVSQRLGGSEEVHEGEVIAAITGDNVQSLTNLIADLKEKLVASEALRESLCKKLEEQMMEFQSERLAWEQKHNDTVAGLSLQLQRSQEEAEMAAARDKHEKEHLNEELRDLKEKLRIEVESSQALKMQHNQDLQASNLKLQSLEEEREKMHQELSVHYEDQVKLLQQDLGIQHNSKLDGFKHELEDLKKNLNRVKARKEHDNYEAAQLCREGEDTEPNPITKEPDIMDKYLVCTCRQQVFDLSENQGESSDHSRFELDSDIILEQSLNSTVGGNLDLFCSPMPIANVLAGGASEGTMLDPESFAVYLSRNVLSPAEKSELGLAFDESLVHRCSVLVEQLHDKECQLQKCSDDLEEALRKWREVTAELSAARSEVVKEKASKEEGLEEWEGQHSPSLQQMVEQLQSERNALSVQIKDQEQLVKEAQEQKAVSEGEHCREMETLITSALSAKEECLSQLLEEKNSLQETLSDVDRRLDKALEQSKNLELSNIQLSHRLQDCEKAQESDRQEFDNQLNSKGLEKQLLEEAMKEKEEEFYQKERCLCEEVCSLKQAQAELESRLREEVDRLNAGFQISGVEWKEHTASLKQEHERELSQLWASHSEELSQLRACHSEELSQLHASHSEELLRVRTYLSNDQQRLLEELQQQEQALLQAQSVHHVELEALRLSLTNMHAAHLELSQANLHKEKEGALVQLRERLNDKRAQEVAILQGRHQFDMKHLREKHLEEMELLSQVAAQEMMLVREEGSREMEQQREQHFQEMEQLREERSREVEQLREQRSQEMEQLLKQHSEEMEGPLEEWEHNPQQDMAHMRETQVTEVSTQHEEALEELRAQLEEQRSLCEVLSEQHQSEVTILRAELDKLSEEMRSLFLSKAQEQVMGGDSEQAHQSQVTALREQYEKDIEGLRQKISREEEEQLQVNKLQSAYDELKAQSSQEIEHLWSQLDSTRTSRQELSELKEQLLARSAHVEEIERLKQDFEQQRLQLKAEHGREMEELRIYFEQKSRATEENYREDLEILHQRMQEEDREELAAQTSSSVAVNEASKQERINLHNQLTEQLEQHKEELSYLRLQSEEKHQQEFDTQRATLTLQFKEDLVNMKLDLSDRYICEIEALKKKHCLALEHLRAKLSEEHIKEITRLHLQSAQEAARQVEAEVAEKLQAMEANYHVSLLLPEKQQVVELEKAPEQLTTDQELVLGQHEKQPRAEPDKQKEHMLCQKVLHPPPECTGHDLETLLSVGDCTLQEADVKGKQDCATVQSVVIQSKEQLSRSAPLQGQCDMELAAAKEQMGRGLEEVTHRLRAECDNALRTTQDRCDNALRTTQDRCDNALRTTQDRFEQECKESTEKQPSLLGELKERNLSGAQDKHKEQTHDLLPPPQPGASVLREQQQRGSEDDLSNRVSELQQLHEEDLSNRVSELQQLHEEDLSNRVSELQQLHEEELSNRVSELQRQHEAQVEYLETTHLSKLDTLESSYLTEIQTIRDEHTQALAELEICLCDRLLQKEQDLQDKLAQAEARWRTQHAQDLQLAREHTGKELAAVHMEKLKAMSEELEAAHMEELKEQQEQQNCQLEKKNQALDSLREEVLRMEEQNQTALQELCDLHRSEVQRQTQRLQEELDKLKEQLQRQELRVAELNSQRQSLSAELQNKSEQQLRFQDEIELLKCQSEMLLEQQITQLKDEFEVQKRAALQEKEEMSAREAETEQTVHQTERESMMQQLQEKSRLVLQLQDRVSALAEEMEASNSQLEMLVQRRERENQEGENLVAMLRSDVGSAQQEQKKLQHSCQRLIKIFTEVLKSTLSTEDLISKKIGLCLDNSLSQDDTAGDMDALAKPWGLSVVLKASELPENSEQHRESPDCETMTEHSLLSCGTDEGYELSEYLCDSMFGSLELGLENEEKILRIGQRLRTAVERLLEMVTGSATQLEQTHEMQQRFQEQFNRRNQETAQVVIQNQDLLKHLEQETETKNQLQVELHKAQGIIDGYTVEKVTLEEALSAKETAERLLVVELEKAREQLKMQTQEPPVFEEEREVLQRLQEVLSGNMRDVEVELLKETERLAKEKLELHCQAKKDRSNLQSQMKVLEVELEEQVSRNQELLRRMSDVSDLRQQIQSLEKQLKNQRHFMDEQAVEREHERDDFQHEIQKLEEQLKQTLKNLGESRAHGLHDWGVQLETLEARVKEKADDCNLLRLGKDHLEQEIAERNEEIDKMSARIQELEQAALSNSEAAKKCSQLEAELQEVRRTEQELLQDKDALQQQHYNNVLQLSALQSKVDEARHWVPVAGEPDQALKEQLQAEREALFRKEKEVESLVEQLEQFREDLISKTEEVLQLNMQLEVQCKQSELAVHQVQEKNLQLKLHRDPERTSSSLELPQALMREKNQEIDHLNEQLLRLQQEMQGASYSQVAESRSAEMEDLRSVVEHLRSDQDRLRKDKEEEVEQLHEVIEKLQQELEQLGPVRHEVSDSQESLDELGLGEVENLQRELRKGARQVPGWSVKELQEELEEVSTAREALEQQLEEREALCGAEVEVLEQNLHNLQESSRQQLRELHTLRLQHSSLQDEGELLRTRLSQREAEVAILSSQVQEMDDSLRESEASLMEKELLVQTLQEQRIADLSELEDKLSQRDVCLEVTDTELQELHAQNSALDSELQEHREKVSKLLQEQSKREERYKEEIQKLKQHLREWEAKTRLLTEEIQRLDAKVTAQSQLPSEPETERRLVGLNEQLRAAENVAREREAELKSTEGLLTSMRCELAELRGECERRGARAEQVRQQLKERDVRMVELQTHSQSLRVKVQKLQEALGCQETTIASLSMELQQYSHEMQDGRGNNPSEPLKAADKPRSFRDSLTDMSTWDSPEMLRKQEDNMHSLQALTPFFELSMEYSADLDLIQSKSSVFLTRPVQFIPHDLGSSTPSLTGSSYSMQDSHETHSSSPVGDAERTLTESSSFHEDETGPAAHKMASELSEELYYRAELAERLLHTGQEEVDSRRERGLPAHLQSMLQMVHEESCKILALSERPALQRSYPIDAQPLPERDTWQREKQNLQEAIQSLRGAMTQAAGRREKDAPDVGSDWRGELLHTVQGLFEKEREYLRLELQSHLRHHGSGDKGSLAARMEHLVKEQEEQKRLVLEHLLSSDRSSLLSEIQDLRSQLRMAHLQNQEKLQHLQETLTSTEERGNTKDHQLRRQVELLEFKLQQEASIGADLKASLSREQERASEQRRHLLAEQSAVCQLGTEVEESRLEQEKLLKLQKELQMEISRLRGELESTEQAVSVCTQTLQSQREQEKHRMEKEEEEKMLVQQRQEQMEQTLQERSTSLEEQRAQHNQLSVALTNEQTCSSNLRKEIQIEQSRCQALLTQERSKLSEAEQQLENERLHSLSLSSSLNHERDMQEQLGHRHSQELSRKEQERLQLHNLLLALQTELEEERRRSRDLAVMMEKTQHQAIHAKRQLEAEVLASREETQKERESCTKLRAMLESLQSQKQHMDGTLEQQRERESRLQTERDQYQARLLLLQEQERSWAGQRENERSREQQAENKREKEQERERRIQDLEMQHLQDQRRIQELQHMLADLEEQERALASRKGRLRIDSFSPARNPSEVSPSAVHVQRLEKVWQQLLHTVLRVKEWVHNGTDRTLAGCPGEEAVTSLLNTLSELRSDIHKGFVQPPAQSSSSLMDVLLGENGELLKSVTALTEEKLELKNQLAKLSQSLQQPPHRGTAEEQLHSVNAVDSALEVERAAWLRERRLLQHALKHAESELAKVTSEIENRPVTDVNNSKMQRLYRKYLKAESFRKALVYQKKYLLLLLGGFHACEKATLSLIAHMGVYPSPADLQARTSPHNPGLTKFRSAVRAIIAISRLKFLVKKWHKISRKGGVREPVMQSSAALLQGPVSRTDVLRQQQLSSILLKSPPTRDVTSCHHSSPAAVSNLSPKPAYWSRNRLVHTPVLTPERSRCSTQDPEHSLTEYIRHLEVVQQRLGSLQEGSSPG